MPAANSSVVVLISAKTEWQVVKARFTNIEVQSSPYGEWFTTIRLGPGNIEVLKEQVTFFHGGYGKISAAASTQFAIDRWSPGLLVNLGTCGGFKGSVERGIIILAEKTIVYDIIEQMGESEEVIAHYTTYLDLSWIQPPFPQDVLRTLLVSGDRDLLAKDIPLLQRKYGAVAGDWESGAIAYVAQRNKVDLLILRGVTDLVGQAGGEAYGNIKLFEDETFKVMGNLLDALPKWIEMWRPQSSK
jgi:adenosylhomocysteine nucleosidase